MAICKFPDETQETCECLDKDRECLAGEFYKSDMCLYEYSKKLYDRMKEVLN